METSETVVQGFVSPARIIGRYIVAPLRSRLQCKLMGCTSSVAAFPTGSARSPNDYGGNDRRRTEDIRASRTPSVISLNSLLDNPVTYMAFVKFLQEAHCDSLVQFLTAVRDFKAVLGIDQNVSYNNVTLMSESSFESIMRSSKNAPETEEDKEKVLTKQQKIYERFLGPSAALPVKVDKETINDVQSKLGAPNFNIFHTAVLKASRMSPSPRLFHLTLFPFPMPPPSPLPSSRNMHCSGLPRGQI